MVRSAGHWSALSSATASSATRGALATRSSPTKCSQPACFTCSRWAPGYERTCVSLSLVAVAEMPPPHSTIRCSQ